MPHHITCLLLFLVAHGVAVVGVGHLVHDELVGGAALLGERAAGAPGVDHPREAARVLRRANGALDHRALGRWEREQRR